MPQQRLQSLPDIDPKNKAYWLKKGTLQQMQGDFGNAALDLDRAIAIDAKYKDAIYRKALSELSANNTSQAIELLDRVIAIDGKYKLAYNAKGQALEMQGDYEGAIAAYDEGSCHRCKMVAAPDQ